MIRNSQQSQCGYWAWLPSHQDGAAMTMRRTRMRSVCYLKEKRYASTLTGGHLDGRIPPPRMSAFEDDTKTTWQRWRLHLGFGGGNVFMLSVPTQAERPGVAFTYLCFRFVLHTLFCLSWAGWEMSTFVCLFLLHISDGAATTEVMTWVFHTQEIIFISQKSEC